MKREIGWVDDKVIVWHCDWVAGGSLNNGLFTPREALHKQVAFCPIRLGKDELRSETGLDASGLHFFQCYKTLMQLNSRSCTLGPIRPQKPPSPSPSHPTKTRKRKRNPRAPHLMRFRSLYPLRKKNQIPINSTLCRTGKGKGCHADPGNAIKILNHRSRLRRTCFIKSTCLAAVWCQRYVIACVAVRT